MFGPYTDPRTAYGIGQAFGEASERIRQLRERSDEREGLGQRGRREDSDTDDLIDDFESAISLQIQQLLPESLRASSVRINVEFHATNLPQGEETRFGADFGVRLHVAGEGFNISKAVLFQNKRAYNSGENFDFRELRGRGERQAANMLSVTPASFFLLFNGIPVRRTLSWLKWPSAWWPLERYGPFPPFPPRLWRDMATSREFAIWNPGVLVLPASRVYAESRVLVDGGKKLPVGARHWVNGAVPLGVFIADLLGSCFVGDVRDEVLRLVTPPGLRDLSAAGVPPFDPTMLPIRRLMDISVSTIDG